MALKENEIQQCWISYTYLLNAGPAFNKYEL